MDFGKLKNINRVDFNLPETDEILFPKTRKEQTPRVYVGCPIWANKNWAGSVYAKGAKAADYLRLYAQQFNAIELNTTHYRIPDPLIVRHWRESVPPGFRFSPKFPQQISHDLQLIDAEAPTALFCENLKGLGENLGMSFLQLPPYFEPRKLEILGRFLDLLPEGFATAVEFRHPAWFKDHQLREDCAKLLTQYHAATVITDVAGRRDVLHTTLPSTKIMIRFVGNNLHYTDYERIDAWIQKFGHWFERGLNELYFFIHEPENDASPELVNYFIQEFNAAYGFHLEGWKIQNSPAEQLSMLF